MGLSAAEETELAALLEAERGSGPDPEWLSRSKADQQDAYDAEQPSFGERMGAAGMGAANALSFNLADEARGVGTALGDLAHPVDAYERGRDAQRAAVGEAQEAAPASYGWGELAGTLLPAVIPGTAAARAPTVAKGAAVGAGTGAVGGFGGGEGAEDSVTKAGIGAALGAVLGGGATAASRVPSPVPAIQRGAAAVDDAAAAVQKLAADNPVARGGIGMLTGGTSEGMLGGVAIARKLAGAIKGKPAAPPVEAGPMAVAPPPAPKAEPPPIPQPTRRVRPQDIIEEAPVDAPPAPAPAAAAPDELMAQWAKLSGHQPQPPMTWESLPMAPPTRGPMSDQQIAGVLKEAAAKGEPLASLAKRLGVPQGDIRGKYAAVKDALQNEQIKAAIAAQRSKAP